MVSNRVREVRKKIGMPLSELARRSGASRQTITNIELYGQIPNGILMIKICEVLNKDPKEIFLSRLQTKVSKEGEEIK